jgi:hypothetical protein
MDVFLNMMWEGRHCLLGFPVLLYFQVICTSALSWVKKEERYSFQVFPSRMVKHAFFCLKRGNIHFYLCKFICASMCDCRSWNDVNYCKHMIMSWGVQSKVAQRTLPLLIKWPDWSQKWLWLPTDWIRQLIQITCFLISPPGYVDTAPIRWSSLWYWPTCNCRWWRQISTISACMDIRPCTEVRTKGTTKSGLPPFPSCPLRTQWRLARHPGPRLHQKGEYRCWLA